jgi:hypothetical protein
MNKDTKLSLIMKSLTEFYTKDPEYIEIAKRLTYQPIFTGPEALKVSIQNFESNVGPRLEKAFPRKPN